MCFSKPKPPKTTDPTIDPQLTRDRQIAELDAAAIRAENKRARMEDNLARLSGRYGRKSMFTGGQGGRGYAAPRGRSLFVGNGASQPANLQT